MISTAILLAIWSLSTTIQMTEQVFLVRMGEKRHHYVLEFQAPSLREDLL
ncbi:MAG TPA: hypothetical protein VEL31_11190 [Ktedonobacteraceae bacterium]|nr:hypothetical protein [Ktedonobacteraceae bacterium]